MSTDNTQPCPACAGELPAVLTCRKCDGTGINLQHQLAVIRGEAIERVRAVDDAAIEAMRVKQGWALPEDAEERALLRQTIRDMILNNPQDTTAHALALPTDPHLVSRWEVEREREDAIDAHALATAFREMAAIPAPPPPDNTLQQREAIGRAIAEYMTSARRGEDADIVAARVVGALGPVEAWAVADVLGKWVGAIAAAAQKAERMGLKR